MVVDGDDIVFFDVVGCDVDVLVVYFYMVVVYELMCGKDGGDEFCVIDDGIQMVFQQVDQVFIGVIFDVFGFCIDVVELFFGQIVVIVFQFLFGVQLGVEVGQFVFVVLIVLVRVVFVFVQW